MISIVCVYNNENTLNSVLLRGLENQSALFELITLDNRGNRFKSAAEALNYGGEKAKGDYIMFAHQDMWFGDTSWLENAEKSLKMIPELGVAGVMGSSETGSNWAERCRHSVTVFDENWNIPPVEGVEEVQTLDECVLIVPQSVFSKLKFDETIFDGWDCYGPDYCLAVKKLGKKAYVIPGDCCHCCLRESTRPWEFKDLFRYQKRLYKKYKRDYKEIYAWMGKLSWATLRFNDILNVIGPLYIRLLPGYDALLSKELSGCDSVLDLGCGHCSPIHMLNIPFSVGVETSDLYLQQSERLGVHSEYVAADIREIEFKEGSFDAVIALDVLDHLTKQEGIELIGKMERWANKMVVIRVSNMSSEKGISSINDNTKGYRSSWEAKEFNELGFRVRGIGGWKHVKQVNTYLLMLLSALSQKIVFYFPKQAVSLLTSKKVT